MSNDSWDYSSAWEETVRQIETEISEQEFLMWFRNMEYARSEESRLFLSVPSSFYRDQILQRYSTTIEDRLHQLLGTRVELDFEIKTADKTEAPPKKKSDPVQKRSGLNALLELQETSTPSTPLTPLSLVRTAALLLTRRSP